MVAFDIDLRKVTPEIQQTKWNMATRELLEKKTFSLPKPSRHPIVPGYFFRFGGDNSYTLCQISGTKLLLGCRHSGSQYFATIHLEYDHDADRLTTHWINCAEHYAFKGWYPSAYLGQNLMYRISVRTADLFIYNTTTGNATRHSIRQQINNRALHDEWNPSLDCVNRVKLFGDCEVVGFVFKTGYFALDFQPKFAPSSLQMKEIP